MSPQKSALYFNKKGNSFIEEGGVGEGDLTQAIY